LLSNSNATKRFIAHDPGVVAGFETVGVTRAEVGLGAVVRGDVDRAGDDVPEVRRLTTVRAGHRLDAVRPPPPRLEGEATHGGVAQVDDTHARLVRGPRLVGAVHALRLDAGARWSPPADFEEWR
jgi:hypothetical protein